MPRIEPGRLPGLDGLRAFSVAWVILYHLHFGRLLAAPDWVHAVARHGYHGVTVFFVLSGFLITTLLLKEEERHGRISLGSFYFRRALRILPPAWFYVACVAVLQVVRGPELQPRAWLVDWLAALGFVRNLTVPAGSYLTGHLWTLSIEEQFYIVWPLLVMLVPTQSRLWVTLGLCLLAPVWRQVNVELYGAPNLNWMRADLRYDSLLIGALVALAQQRPWFERCLDRRAGATRVLLLASIGVFTGLVYFGGALPKYLQPARITLQLLAVAFVIKIVSEGRAPWTQAVLNVAPVAWIGRLSYSLYLWQQIFCIVDSGWRLERFPLNLIASFLCAAFSYYLVELPALRLRQRVQPRWFGRHAAATVPAAPSVDAHDRPGPNVLTHVS